MRLTIWHEKIQELLLSGSEEPVKLGMYLIEDKIIALHWYHMDYRHCDKFKLPYLSDENMENKLDCMVKIWGQEYFYFSLDARNTAMQIAYEEFLNSLGH